MKKRIKIIIIAIIILLGIVFIRPISFYMAIISNGYKPTKIEKFKTIEETRYGKSILVIVKEKKENFNLILLSNKHSLFWHIKKSGKTSSEAKPYSLLEWDRWLVEDNGSLSTRTHKTIVYKTESNISIDTKMIPSSLEFCLSQYNDFSIVDIYTKTPHTKEIDQLDITKFIY